MNENDDTLCIHSVDGAESSAVDIDFDKELKFLNDRLVQVRDKLVNQWTGSDLKKHMREDVMRSNNTMTQHEEKKTALRENIKTLQMQQVEVQKAAESQGEEMERLGGRIEQVKQQKEDLLRQKELVNKQITMITEDNLRQKELIESQGKTTEKTFKELEKSYSMFKDTLGVIMKRVSGERLQFVFTHIDYNDTSSPYFFSVRIKPDRTYEVPDCEPMVPDLDDLIKKLDSTNNFRSFVIALRQRFKTYAQTS